MKILNRNQILLLHKTLIEKFGGVSGVRDENLLDSAIYAPFQTFGGNELYPTEIEKSARLAFGLIKNHPFIDGNKRIGTHAMLTFLELNNVFIEYAEEDLLEIIFRVAEGSCDYSDLLQWIKNHIEN